MADLAEVGDEVRRSEHGHDDAEDDNQSDPGECSDSAKLKFQVNTSRVF